MKDWKRELRKAFSMHFKKDHHQNKLAVLESIVEQALLQALSEAEERERERIVGIVERMKKKT